MRSRYTAYTLQREDYLLETWHPATRPEKLELDADPLPRWLGLKIVAIEAGQPVDSDGLVEFVARYKRGGKATRLHERSYFKQIDGRWLYVGAEVEQR
jgi:SEC-C motif-containing protein